MSKRIKLIKALSVYVDKAKEPHIVNAEITKTMSLYLLKEWSKLAKPMISKADKVAHTKEAINSFIKSINSQMKNFGGNVEEETKKYVSWFYTYSKEKFIKDNKIKIVEKVKLPTLDPSILIAVDTEAIAALEGMATQSTNTFYGSSVQATVAESVKKNIFERGLAKAEATKAMKSDLAKALKMKVGGLESKIVPQGFSGTADAYFSGLAEGTASVARTASTLQTLSSVGAKKFVIRSVKSARTCIGCLGMDGTVYTVAEGMAHLNKMLKAENLDALKKVAPFFSFKVSGGNSEAKIKEAKNVSSMVRTPPFHFRCECYIDMV